MAYQTVFKRYELKYMLTIEQKKQIMKAMEPYMALDKYGRTTICNLYFDTEDYRLIRHSIEKPSYKEKLRVRCYRRDGELSDKVFVELKKKYDHVVYKRRIAMPESEAMEWLFNRKQKEGQSQISSEVDYFMEYYKNPRPAIFLSYEREAYYAKDGSDFRVTFDDHILCREDRLSLKEAVGGTSLLEEDKVLMELKCSGGIPLWMTHILTELQVYKTSFSKYGTYYMNYIYPRLEEEFKHGRIV